MKGTATKSPFPCVAPRWRRRHPSRLALAVLACAPLAAAPLLAQGPPSPAAPAYTPTTAPTVYAPPQPESNVMGGVARGEAHPGTVALTLNASIQMGLRNNLAVLLSSTASEQARAQRWQALAGVLPKVQASVGDEETKENLAAFGFSFPGFPQIVGPFRVFDARGYLDVPVLNVSDIETLRSSGASQAAAAYSYQQARNLVVMAVADQYLLTSADASRVAAAQAQLRTARQALAQSEDMYRAGTVSILDVVRAKVQRDRERQSVIVQQDDWAKQKLALARAIGLPLGQVFRLAQPIPLAPAPAFTVDQALQEALRTRPDYRAAHETVRAARLAVASARDQRLPTLDFSGNWGTIGNRINSNHPTFTIAGQLNLPVFQGGAIHAAEIAARARLQRARDQASDLRAAIGQQVRSALLDVRAAGEQVHVAEQARGLARQELTLARDRFRAGVGDNLEEVEAEQEVAVAEENYITSLYSFNAAKIEMAQALGVAQAAYPSFLEGAK
ncbi:MAG: TolC family protein [Terriglobales bacterium]